MGHKIHPNAPRLGYIHDWQSKWFSLREMPALIGEDYKIRDLVNTRFKRAAVSWVGIERAGAFLRVNIHTARPGVVIGKKGADIEALRTDIEKLTGRKSYVNVMEIKEPELDANLVAEAVAIQIERRINHRRAIRRALERSRAAGALGIKIHVSGRLGGNEIARSEWQREGRVPLHTFSADIDYGFREAETQMGRIGVKCWIFKKQYFAKSPAELVKQLRREAPPPPQTPEGGAAPAAPAGEAPAVVPAAVEGVSVADMPIEPMPESVLEMPAETEQDFEQQENTDADA
jgi:small subunit ribosomal protein S3